MMLQGLLIGAIGVGLSVAPARAQEGRTWPSPDGRLSVLWARIAPVDDPGDQYAAEFIGPGRAPARIATFEDDLDVLWAADGRHAALTLYRGSDRADCVVADVANPGHPVRLTALLPSLPETPQNSHFYASCEQWHGSRRLLFTVAGRFDSATAPRPFAYGFSYDLRTGRVTRR